MIASLGIPPFHSLNHLDTSFNNQPQFLQHDVIPKACCTDCDVSLLHCSYNVSFLHISIFTVSFTPSKSSSSYILFCRLLTTSVPSNTSIFSTPSHSVHSVYTFQTPHHILCSYTRFLHTSFSPSLVLSIYTFLPHQNLCLHCPSTLESSLIFVPSTPAESFVYTFLPDHSAADETRPDQTRPTRCLCLFPSF